MKLEVFKSIIELNGVYEVSNLGRIKSLKRNKEIILKPAKASNGYLTVNLIKNKKPKTYCIHQLVAIYFLNHTPCGYKKIVNHKDHNRENNYLNNLEIVSVRDNTNQAHLPSKSKYVGVSWDKSVNKWISRIRIKNNRIFLGLFKNEIDAHNAYKKALNELNVTFSA